MNKVMSVLEGGAKRPLSIAAGVAFFAAIGLAIVDRTSAATLCAGIFIVSTLLHYFPQLESFKAIGVEAKLRLRLAEADEIMEKIKRLALVSGTQMYTDLANAGRITDQRLRESRIAANEMDAVLKSLDFPIDALRTAKKNYIQMIGVDLFSVVAGSVEKLLKMKQDRVAERQHALFAEGALDQAHPKHAEYMELVEASRKIGLASMEQNLDMSIYRYTDLSELLKSKLFEAAFTGKELTKLHELIGVVVDLHRDCVLKNAMTDETLDFLEANVWDGEGRQKLALSIIE